MATVTSTTIATTVNASVMARRVLEGAAEERQHAAPVHDAHPEEERRKSHQLRHRPRRRSGLHRPAFVEKEVQRVEPGGDDEAQLAVPGVSLHVLPVGSGEEEHAGY